MTVGELVKFLEKYDKDLEVDMCMDWTTLENPPERLNQQWEDGLGGVTCDGTRIILLNEHFG